MKLEGQFFKEFNRSWLINKKRNILEVISAGIDNTIKIWDMRKAALETTIKGHTDTVTGCSLYKKRSVYWDSSLFREVSPW